MNLTSLPVAGGAVRSVSRVLLEVRLIALVSIVGPGSPIEKSALLWSREVVPFNSLAATCILAVEVQTAEAPEITQGKVRTPASSAGLFGPWNAIGMLK